VLEKLRREFCIPVNPLREVPNKRLVIDDCVLEFVASLAFRPLLVIEVFGAFVEKARRMVERVI
jgi:hypothetical protein